MDQRTIKQSVAMNERRICAQCKHWTMGDTWGTPMGRDHGVTVESKGWCLAKPNKRKRWNYQPCYKCALFEARDRDGIIISGTGVPTKEQLQPIFDFIDEKLR